MASIYILGRPGPWSVDDDQIHADGYFLNEHLIGGNTVDGVLDATPRARGRDGGEDVYLGRVMRYGDAPGGTL